MSSDVPAALQCQRADETVGRGKGRGKNGARNQPAVRLGKIGLEGIHAALDNRESLLKEFNRDEWGFFQGEELTLAGLNTRLKGCNSKALPQNVLLQITKTAFARGGVGHETVEEAIVTVAVAFSRSASVRENLRTPGVSSPAVDSDNDHREQRRWLTKVQGGSKWSQLVVAFSPIGRCIEPLLQFLANGRL
jgi:hypothetical protein